MFLTRLFQLLLGYVRFKVDGGSPEKFLNLTARAGITLWNLRREGSGLYANTLESNYKKLLPAAEKAGVRICVIERRGLPSRLSKHRHRYGFIAGVILFFAILWYFSGFVWAVNIEGNSVVETREIQYVLSDLGLKPGVRTDTLDTKKMEQNALVDLPDLSWLHININGGTANVEVGERSPRPEIVADNLPCNVKAAQTGQIISIQVYQGVAVLKVGDTVLKGDLLVKGIVQEPKTGITRYLHARAKVVARTKREIDVTVPFNTTENRDTGLVINKYTIGMLGLEIPLYNSEPSGSFIRTVYQSPLTIGSVQFPVAITTSVFTEYRKVSVVLSTTQALEKAKQLIAQKEKTELSTAKILKSSYSEKSDATGITIIGHYDCEEDIAYEEEVSIGSS